MGEHLIKPYELSIWEDRLITSEDNTTKYFQEFKIAVLGSNTMTSPQKAMNPVLTENVNGEKTLTFSLAYKYFDPFLGERIENPLWKYLVNERKIKLFYNNKWYDFVIKTREESSEDNVFNYTARELFTIELGKVGYNITLDQSLNNNQGTITELAEKVLEDTDWQLDKKNTDLLQQSVQDPVYNGVLQTNLTVLNDFNKSDPNYLLMERLSQLYLDYKKYITTDSIVELNTQGSEFFITDWENKMGLAFSSPPYFDLEDYQIGEQSYSIGTTYENWKKDYIIPTFQNIYHYLIDDGVFALNIKNNKTYALADDMKKIAIDNGFELIDIELLTNNQRNTPSGLLNNAENIFIFKKNKSFSINGSSFISSASTINNDINT